MVAGLFVQRFSFGKRGNIVSEANNEYPFLAAMSSRQNLK